MTTTALPIAGACALVVPVSVLPSAETLTPVSATPPIVAVAFCWIDDPLMLTKVPPAEGPVKGVIVVAVGGGRLEQFANLKVPTRVCQLNVPLAVRYSVVYQKVQSSTGSIAMEL